MNSLYTIGLAGLRRPSRRRGCLLCGALLALALLTLPVAAAAQAPAAEEPRLLRIGLVPEQDLFSQKKRFQPLLAYLAEQAGVAIEIILLPHYENVTDNFGELGLDGAFFGSFTGAVAICRQQLEPLARPQFIGGESSYYGMVFVRQGSGIRTARDMRNKRMVFVNMATTAGYLLPLSYFREIGINNYQQWFGSYYFSGTHSDAIRDVLNGHADIGAAKNTVFGLMAAQDKRVTRELEILATSPRVPANTLALRSDLPVELRRALQQQLLQMHRNPQGRAVLADLGVERFIATSTADFQPVIDFAATLGIDLGNCPRQE